MRCAQCNLLACEKGGEERGTLPGFCPMSSKEEAIRDQFQKYEEEANRQIAISAAKTEAAGYCEWTRLEEIIDFAKRCNYHKLGLAFCSGLLNEARMTVEILEGQGFEVHSVICKTGGIPKEAIGLSDADKVRPGTDESICNPITQAGLLNLEGTDFNLILGLCVGHDTLFMKYSEAPVTVFAAKDRVLTHNPLGCLYGNYHIKKRFSEVLKP